MSFQEFLGGVRVLQPPPPLGVFDTYPYMNAIIGINIIGDDIVGNVNHRSI